MYIFTGTYIVHAYIVHVWFRMNIHHTYYHWSLFWTWEKCINWLWNITFSSPAFYSLYIDWILGDTWTVNALYEIQRTLKVTRSAFIQRPSAGFSQKNFIFLILEMHFRLLNFCDFISYEYTIYLYYFPFLLTKGVHDTTSLSRTPWSTSCKWIRVCKSWFSSVKAQIFFRTI